MAGLRLVFSKLPGHAAAVAAASILVCAIVLGGGTRSGNLADALLQLLSIPVLVFAVSRLCARRPSDVLRAEGLFWLAAAALPVLQLLPLPSAAWAALPGNALRLESLKLAGQHPGWLPLSLTPNETCLNALSLIPPAAIFFSTMTLDWAERRMLSGVVVGMGIISVFLGLLQLAQGESSNLRLYRYTNPGEAVGFFANRNHFAAFLYVVLLFAAVWMVQGLTGSIKDERQSRANSTTLIAAVGGFTVLFILPSGEFMARSRAGLGLAILALLASLSFALPAARSAAQNPRPVRLILASVALTAFAALQFAIYRIMERFAFDPLQDARFVFYRNTLGAARGFMPTGSGLGSFVRVYATLERPQDALLGAFVNHAHNDFLELWLETGIAGLALLAAFGIWFSWRSIVVWRSNGTPRNSLDLWVSRAASVAVALLLLHSSVDYPLRTAAMMGVFALLCALLTDPRPSLQSWPATVRPLASESHLASTRVRSVSSNAPSSQPNQIQDLWESDKPWPARWRRPEQTAERSSDRPSEPTPTGNNDDHEGS